MKAALSAVSPQLCLELADEVSCRPGRGAGHTVLRQAASCPQLPAQAYSWAARSSQDTSAGPSQLRWERAITI